MKMKPSDFIGLNSKSGIVDIEGIVGAIAEAQGEDQYVMLGIQDEGSDLISDSTPYLTVRLRCSFYDKYIPKLIEARRENRKIQVIGIYHPRDGELEVMRSCVGTIDANFCHFII